LLSLLGKSLQQFEGLSITVNANTSSLTAKLLKIPRRVLEGLRIYHRPLGIRGVGAICSYRLFGWPKELAVAPAGVRNPVYIRMRTTDVSVYHEVLICGQYAIDLPFSPKIIVDAGANIGMASLYFATKYPQARIIAIEPETSNFAMLAQNVGAYPNILPIHAALWSRDGEIGVNTPGSFESPLSKVGFVVREGQGVPVRAITVRTLMRETGIQCIDILKVDIEGAEKEVFETCDWMDTINCLMIELHDRLRPGSSAAVDAVSEGFLLSKHGETTVYIRKSCLSGVDEPNSVTNRT
jgi:FkbM family methyltransferase